MTSPASRYFPRLLPLLAILAGCQGAPSAPLSAAALEDALAPPAWESLRVRANAIRHPILRSVPFDERDGLSPDEAAVLAVLMNPSLRAIRDQRGIASAQSIQAGILPNPALSAGASFAVHAPDELPGYDLGLSWEVSSLVAVQAKSESAKAQAASVELDVAWKEWEAAQAAKIAVFRCASLDAELAEARKVEERFAKGLDMVRKAAEERLKTTLDLAAAEAALQEARAAVLELEQDLRRQRLLLNRALGLPPEARVRLQAGIRFPSTLALPSARELESGLEERRLDLMALKRGIESQEATVRATVLSGFPRIELGVGYARDPGGFHAVGPSLFVDLPLFDRNHGAVAAESATRQKLLDEFVQRLFEARNDVATALADAESLSRRIACAEEAVPTLERLVKVCADALPEGQVDVLSCYGAQNDLAKKVIEIWKLKQELVERRAELELASGRYLPEREG